MLVKVSKNSCLCEFYASNQIDQFYTLFYLTIFVKMNLDLEYFKLNSFPDTLIKWC